MGIIGSQDMIRTADYAIEHGLVISAFALGDKDLTPLGADENMSVSEQMISMLNTYGLDELDASMTDEFDGVYALGVLITDPSVGESFASHRYDQIAATDTLRERAEAFLASARSALRLP